MVHLKRRVAGLSKGNGINLNETPGRRLIEFYAVVFGQDSVFATRSRLAPEFILMWKVWKGSCSGL